MLCYVKVMTLLLFLSNITCVMSNEPDRKTAKTERFWRYWMENETLTLKHIGNFFSPPYVSCQ